LENVALIASAGYFTIDTSVATFPGGILGEYVAIAAIGRVKVRRAMTVPQISSQAWVLAGKDLKDLFGDGAGSIEKFSNSTLVEGAFLG
jgi:hypothetical protein